ncbi:hypothetical protein BC832DRAFT_550901 [Gaertneriomyces semiglobifer]|nr:hypothetical protein BC832DRAFT_550901 [Gaertneriomyces semiglobifer]
MQDMLSERGAAPRDAVNFSPIWKMGKPDVLMHMHAGNIDDFRCPSMALETGTSLRMAFMQAAFSQSSDITEHLNMLQTCAPDDAQDNMFDPAQRKDGVIVPFG